MKILSVVQPSTLYIVATPIGNLGDLTERAKQVLAEVDIIACEDTRHTSKLLQHLGIKKPLQAIHEHNERERIEQVAELLNQGKSIALVSDAGTPLISDPGFPLVQGLRQQQLQVVPVPGVSAIITALSAAGLPTDRFTFEGFLPHKKGPKKDKLNDLLQEPRTMVFYEAKHRILETLAQISDIFGERPMCLARELTKTFETFYHGSASEILAVLEADNDQQKGEFVIMLAGNTNPAPSNTIDSERLLNVLLKELPPKKACAIVADITGENKKDLYQRLHQK